MLSPSTIADLNKAIESSNPFDRSLVVRSHDIWEQNFPDVPSINAHISDRVFQGIEQIRRGERSVLGITILAEKGLGKSHLLSRIRNRIKSEGGCFFVCLGEVDYGDLNLINSQFLLALAFSLKQSGSQGVTQWQELAAALVNQITKSNSSTQEIINRFPGALAKNPSLVDNLTARFCQLAPEIQDPYLVQAILWTLLPVKGMFAINWLSGKDLAQIQADSLGLPASHDGDRESRALSLASQILDLIGYHRTIVICFDEVEPKSCNSQGLTTPQVVALLAKDLYSKLKRGILMMSMYAVTWSHQVKALPQAEAVTDRIGEKVLDLKYLNSDDIVALVSVWLKEFYDAKGLTPPHAVYPFDESELRALGKEKPIVRRVLQWCNESWTANAGNGNVILPPPLPHHRVEVAFKEQLLAVENELSDCWEKSELLAAALKLGYSALEGETITLRDQQSTELGQIKVNQIQDIVTKNVDKGYMHFKVIGEENGAVIKIGVCVLQDSGTKYVSAALKRLIDYKKFDLTRGCLVRSKAVKEKTKGSEYLSTLLSAELGGEWVLIPDESIKPLLAILRVHQACQDYEVTEDEVIQFIKQEKIAENNYLINDILSDPSGQIPNGVVDEDALIIEESKTPGSNDEIDSIDALIGKLNNG